MDNSQINNDECSCYKCCDKLKANGQTVNSTVDENGPADGGAGDSNLTFADHVTAPIDNTVYLQDPIGEATCNLQAPAANHAYPQGPVENHANLQNLTENHTYAQGLLSNDTDQQGPIGNDAYPQGSLGNDAYPKGPLTNELNPHGSMGNNVYPQSPTSNDAYLQSPLSNDVYPQGPISNDTYPQSPLNNDAYSQSSMANDAYSQGPLSIDAYPQGPLSNELNPQGLMGNSVYPQGLLGNDAYLQGPLNNELNPQGPLSNELNPQGSMGNNVYPQGTLGNDAYSQGPLSNDVYSQGPISNDAYSQGPVGMATIREVCTTTENHLAYPHMFHTSAGRGGPKNRCEQVGKRVADLLKKLAATNNNLEANAVARVLVAANLLSRGVEMTVPKARKYVIPLIDYAIQHVEQLVTSVFCAGQEGHRRNFDQIKAHYGGQVQMPSICLECVCYEFGYLVAETMHKKPYYTRHKTILLAEKALGSDFENVIPYIIYGTPTLLPNPDVCSTGIFPPTQPAPGSLVPYSLQLSRAPSTNPGTAISRKRHVTSSATSSSNPGVGSAGILSLTQSTPGSLVPYNFQLSRAPSTNPGTISRKRYVTSSVTSSFSPGMSLTRILPPTQPAPESVVPYNLQLSRAPSTNPGTAIFRERHVTSSATSLSNPGVGPAGLLLPTQSAPRSPVSYDLQLSRAPYTNPGTISRKRHVTSSVTSSFSPGTSSTGILPPIQYAPGRQGPLHLSRFTMTDIRTQSPFGQRHYSSSILSASSPGAILTPGVSPTGNSLPALRTPASWNAETFTGQAPLFTGRSDFEFIATSIVHDL